MICLLYSYYKPIASQNRRNIRNIMADRQNISNYALLRSFLCYKWETKTHTQLQLRLPQRYIHGVKARTLEPARLY